ncbi:MAG: VWA domain-containing protein [Candidatus Aminicenantales bacterium]
MTLRKSLARALLIVFCLTSFGLIKTASVAQEKTQQDQLKYEVQVALKLVQVYVTDKKGNPVTDLAKEDFTLLDEGKPQTITDFERHVLTAKEEGRPEPAAQPDDELMPRKFFLLFDFAFNNGIGLEKSREAAVGFIDEQLQPTDEVSLLSYSAIKGLKLHEYLTTDHKKVRKIVKRIGMESISGTAENFEAIYWQAKAFANPADTTRSGTVFDPKEIFGEEREWGWEQSRQEAKMQANNFAIKLTEMAKALRYIPGHKSIVLLSSGVPYSLVYGIQSPFGKIGVEEFGEFWLQQKFEEMLDELSAANCTIYALDTQEQSAVMGSDLRMQGASSLQKLTSATGGKYFGNINNYEEHIEKIQALTGCYYVLGYYVGEAWDGAFRKIKVEVNRPNCNVLAQKGYFNPKPFKEYNDLERMLHLFDLALSEAPLFQVPVRFPLRVVPCSPEAKGNLCLAARVRLEDIREILTDVVEMVTVIFDDKDNVATLKKSLIKVSELKGETASFGGSFSLPAGSYKCRLVIRNLETGRGAVASTAAVISGQ